jgi:hypothetical protein
MLTDLKCLHSVSIVVYYEYFDNYTKRIKPIVCIELQFDYCLPMSLYLNTTNEVSIVNKILCTKYTLKKIRYLLLSETLLGFPSHFLGFRAIRKP